jgi:hypothetical protein
VIRIKIQHALSFILPLFLTALPCARYAAAASPEAARYQLQPVETDMSADEYRRTYRDNQHRLRKFMTHYSEKTLGSLGIPKNSLRMVGALAGVAITQDATLYLNDSKWLAIDIKDAAQDDRAIIFAIKQNW